MKMNKIKIGQNGKMKTGKEGKNLKRNHKDSNNIYPYHSYRCPKCNQVIGFVQVDLTDDPHKKIIVIIAAMFILFIAGRVLGWW